MLLSYILIAVIASVFAAIVVCGIRNKKSGRSSCSCGGNCGACNLCHTQSSEENKEATP